jgi:hypothetical protein
MPSVEDEQLLNDVIEDSVDKVSIKGTSKEYKIGWLKKGTMRKMTSVALEKGKDDTLSVKTAALIVLNNYWKIKFFYPILWRWWFYVKEYTDEQLAEILAVGKKKVPYIAFLTNTILVTGMRDTMMTMTKEEAERIRQGLHTEKPRP